MLQENLPNLVAVKSMQLNPPEQLMAKETQQEAVATFNSAAINENDIVEAFEANQERDLKQTLRICRNF